MSKEEKLPKVSHSRQEHRIRVTKLEIAIQEAIDKVCDDYEYQVTYNEINTALTRALSSNLGFESKDYFEEKGAEA